MKKTWMALLAAACLPLIAKEPVPFGNPETFSSTWESVGTVPLAEKTVYTLVENPDRPGQWKMVVTTNSSNGMIASGPKIDLKATPIMRWRWRVVKPLDVAPGDNEEDDQAIHLSIGDGDRISERGIGYRWEVNTEIGKSELKRYNLGQMQLGTFTLRNRTTAPGVWVTEERNVLADYRAFFKDEIKSEFAILIGGNTQHLEQESVAEIDFIEFLSEEEAKANPIPAVEK